MLVIERPKHAQRHSMGVLRTSAIIWAGSMLFSVLLAYTLGQVGEKTATALVLSLLAALIVVPQLHRWCANWSVTVFATWLLGTLIVGREFAHLGVELAGVPLYVTEITLALLLLGVLARGRFLTVLRSLPERWLLLIWGGIGLVALARGFPQYRMGALRESALVYYALFFLLTWVLFDQPDRLKRIFHLGLIGAGGAFLVIFGRYLAGKGTADTTGGMGYNIGSTPGLVLAFLPVMALAAHFFSRERRLQLLLTLLSLPALFAVIFLVQHRSLWLALAAGLAMVVCAGWRVGRMRWREVLLVGLLSLVMLLGSLLVVPEPLKNAFSRNTESLEAKQLRDPNIGLRAFMWGLFVSRGMKNPALGEGFGPTVNFEFNGKAYRGDQNIIHPHNDYVWTFNRMGCLALGVLLWLLWRFYRKGLRILPRLEPEVQWMLAGVMGMHVVVAGFAFANVVLAGPYMGALFWILMGLGYRLMEPTAAPTPDSLPTSRDSAEGDPASVAVT